MLIEQRGVFRTGGSETGIKKRGLGRVLDSIGGEAPLGQKKVRETLLIEINTPQGFYKYLFIELHFFN